MFEIFGKIADEAIAWAGLAIDTPLGSAVHFFIEDTLTIFVLIYVMIFTVSLFRSQLSPDRVREYLSGKSRFAGYILAVILGIVTPFCSCSSIPLFISFVAAGIPFGITMAFLIASPLVSEVAAVMLLGMQGAGPVIAGIYVLTGSVIAIIGGWLCDTLHLERLSSYNKDAIPDFGHHHYATVTAKARAIIIYARNYANNTVRGIALYVLIGLAIGAFMHGYIPSDVFGEYLGRENPFAVPAAVVVGIPIYANHTGVIPIIQVLLLKGVPVGTALAALMSITAISLPELIMLHKVLSWKMLGIFVLFLLGAFIAVGYLLNFVM